MPPVCTHCGQREACIWIGDGSEAWCPSCYRRELEHKRAVEEAERIIREGK